MNRKELITKWVEAFNQADADIIAEFYAGNAVNHQVPNEPVKGKKAIREMFSSESQEPILPEWGTREGLSFSSIVIAVPAIFFHSIAQIATQKAHAAA